MIPSSTMMIMAVMILFVTTLARRRTPTIGKKRTPEGRTRGRAAASVGMSGRTFQPTTSAAASSGGKLLLPLEAVPPCHALENTRAPAERIVHLVELANQPNEHVNTRRPGQPAFCVSVTVFRDAPPYRLAGAFELLALAAEGAQHVSPNFLCRGKTSS